MDEISYVGKWTAFGRAVFVEAGNLSHPLIVGEPESADALGRRDDDTEIARALLLHATSNKELAGRLGASFAETILASLPPAGFRLSREGILAGSTALRAKRTHLRRRHPRVVRHPPAHACAS